MKMLFKTLMACIAMFGWLDLQGRQGPIWTVIGQKDGLIREIAVDSDGGNITFITTDNVLEVWELQGRTAIAREELSESYRGISVSPDKQSLAMGTDGGLLSIRNFPSLKGDVKHPFANGINLLAWRDSNTLILVYKNQVVTSYDTRQKSQNYQTELSLAKTTAIAMSETSFVVADEKGWLDVRSNADGSLLQRFRAHRGMIRSIALDKQSGIIVTGGDDGWCKVFRLGSTGDLFKTKRTMAWITAVAFYKNCILFCSTDGRVEIFTPYNRYTARTGAIITDAVFIPSDDNSLTIGLATLGKGVLLMSAKDMKSSNRHRLTLY